MKATNAKRAQHAVPLLHAYAVFTAFCTFLLIIAGALVTGNDAGLAVPDWPLSYGKLMPPMVGGIFYEHGHRMVAATVGMLTVVLALWLWRAEPRRWVRRLGWIALATVVAQGVLGGITVLFYLPVAVSVAHACLAQIFFCLTVSLALVTSPRWKAATPPPLAPGPSETGARAGQQHPGWQTPFAATPARNAGSQLPTPALALATSGAIFLQLVLGAAFRHSGLGLTPHLVGSAVVSACVFWTMARIVRRHAEDRGLLRGALLVGSMLLAQLFLGVGSLGAKIYYRDAPQPMPLFVAVTTAHVAAGALTLAASVALTLLVLRPVGRAFLPVQNQKPGLETCPTGEAWS